MYEIEIESREHGLVRDLYEVEVIVLLETCESNQKKSLSVFFFFFSSRRRHTRWNCDWSSDVCSFRSVRKDFIDTAEAFGTHMVAKPEGLLDNMMPRDGEGQIIFEDRMTYDRKQRAKDRGDGQEEMASRSEERRVGKECRSRWSAEREK